MFRGFRKHQKWIWILGIIVVIPSFVLFFSPNVDFRRSGESVKGNFGSIYGEEVSRQQYLEAFNQARIGFFFRNRGTWPSNDDADQRQVEQDAMVRLLLQRSLKDHKIVVSSKMVARLAKQQLGDIALARFVAERLAPQRLTGQDYENYLTYEAGLQQLLPVAGLSGRLVNPTEAEVLWKKENENILTEAAVFWTSNFHNQVTVTDPALGRFYTNRIALYREPDRTVIKYLEFSSSNYLSEADVRLSENTNLQTNIDEYYRRQGAEAFKDSNDVIKTELQAKADIREELRHGHAMREAQIKANEVGNALLERPQPNQAGDLDIVAAALGLELKTSPPFSRGDDLTLLGLDSGLLQPAMRLTPQSPLQVNPILGANSVYIIGLSEVLKGQTPPLEQITNKVREDFIADTARTLARSAANNFHAKLTNGLAMNQSFEELCAQSNVERITLPPFSPSTRPPLEGLDPRFNLAMMQRTADNMEIGTASAYLPARDGGFILYLKGRTAGSEEKMKDELPQFTENLRQYRLSQAFDQWIRKLMDDAHLVPPRPETTPSPTGPTAPVPAPAPMPAPVTVPAPAPAPPPAAIPVPAPAPAPPPTAIPAPAPAPVSPPAPGG